MIVITDGEFEVEYHISAEAALGEEWLRRDFLFAELTSQYPNALFGLRRLIAYRCPVRWLPELKIKSWLYDFDIIVSDWDAFTMSIL